MERPISNRQSTPRLRGRFAGAGLAAVLLLSTATFTLPATPAYAADLNVTSYGVSNAGADSTAALQSLLGGGGKSLTFPAGTYRFGGISIPANTTLKFASGAKILPGGGAPTFFNITTSGVTISGGEFDGQGTIGNATVASGATNLNITGSKVTNITGAAFNLVGVSNVYVAQTSAINAQYGIIASGSSYCTFDGNYAYNMGRDGILAYGGAHHLTISNNYIERWATLLQDGRAAIHTYGSSDLTVFGNTIKNGLHTAEGIRFRDSERFDAYNNVVDNTGGSGIAVVWIGDWAHIGLVGGDGTVRNNVISNAHLRGISVPYRNIKPVRILDNTITNTSSNFVPIDPADGIICFPPNSAVVGNRITGSTGNGISVASNGTLVADNVISSVGTQGYGARSGVANYGTNTSIIRNTVNGSASFGFYNAGSMYLEDNSVTNAANGVSNTGSNAGKLNGDSVAPSVWSDIATSYNAGATFSLSASDANSGVAAIRVQVDNGPVRTYYGTPVTMNVGTAGTHIISYWSVDFAGNTSAKQSRTYSVGGVVTPTPTPTPEPDPTPTPVPNPTTIETPANLAGKSTEYNGASISLLTWEDKSANETGYVLERAYEHDGTLDAWVVIDETIPADQNWYNDRVGLGTIYRYRLRAYYGDGTSRIVSQYSNEARVLGAGVTTTPAPTPEEPPVVVPTPDPVPAAPSGLTALATRIRTVQLTWTDNATNEAGYEIWCKRSGVWNLYASVPTDREAYTTKRFPRGTYEFRIRAYNASGASAFGPITTVTMN